ncbi:MAG: twin-arginine translocation signal domain-containing protein [Gemmatimonadetes bacterium]|nr:twin-arginine translocation signal domain-containing protein [Gemmatimonadota bacterium]MBK7831932.1 twin-arginine translocation signal domain-containing protein [Gemmatimonadota bacterium]MBK9411481.1 twin-arginine translocation signal domain-containing protein [Gemmatimonadota bacterium]
MPLTRRTFIKAGAIGAGALAVAGAYEAWRIRDCLTHATGALSPAGRALFAAVVPAFLDGMVAPSAWTPDSMSAMLGNVERTIATLPASARGELQQLACLLDHGPVRLLLAGSWAPWASVTPARARQVLERWRFSGTPMLVSAYQALHDITFASWYAQPSAWVAIGYPGPPMLTASPA